MQCLLKKSSVCSGFTGLKAHLKMDCGDILVNTVYGDIMENICHAGNLAHIMEAVHGFCEWLGERGSNKRQEGVIFSFAAYLAFN